MQFTMPRSPKGAMQDESAGSPDSVRSPTGGLRSKRSLTSRSSRGSSASSRRSISYGSPGTGSVWGDDLTVAFEEEAKRKREEEWKRKKEQREQKDPRDAVLVEIILELDAGLARVEQPGLLLNTRCAIVRTSERLQNLLLLVQRKQPRHGAGSVVGEASGANGGEGRAAAHRAHDREHGGRTEVAWENGAADAKKSED